MTAMKDVSYTFYNTLQTLPTILRSLLSGGKQDWEYVCPQSEFQIWSFCVSRKAMPLLAVKPLFYLLLPFCVLVLCCCFQATSSLTSWNLTLTGPLLKHYSALLQVVTENQKTYLSLTKIFCKESVPKREDTGWSILLCTSEVKKLTGSRDLYQKFMNTNQVRRSLYLKLIVLFNNA